MRLLTFFLFTGLLTAHASGVSQTVTLSGEHLTIKEIFTAIEAQTGYVVLYDPELVASKKTVSIAVKDLSLLAFLDKIIQDQALKYKIEDKTIFVSSRAPNVSNTPSVLFTDQPPIRLRVTDSTGVPLYGATVTLKKGRISGVTDTEGTFSLNVAEGDILIVSFIGMETRTVTVTKSILGNARLDVKLFPVTENLNEIEVNAGYYTVKERERTGNISRITSKDIERQPVNNVLAAMQANIPGVEITSISGVPGSGFKVQIRGQNSIKQGTAPFYIIDGVPFTSTPIAMAISLTNGITPEPSPLASINPSDIESIEVLKDADATAIYGSRGANGVILITTKKGKAGKPIAAFSVNQGSASVAKKLKLMNTEQYLEMRNEAFANDKIIPNVTQYDVNGVWGKDRYTDWQEELIGKSAPSTNIQASISGGATNLIYLIGGGYSKEGTVFPGKNSFVRSSGNLSLRYSSVNQKFTAQFNSNYSQVNSSLGGVDLTSWIFLPPNYPALLTSEGLLNWENNTMYVNPLAYNIRRFNSKAHNLVSHTQLSYEIVPGVQIKANAGYTFMERKDYKNNPLASVSPASSAYNSTSRNAYFGNSSIDTWILEPQINFKRNFGDGKIEFLVGSTLQGTQMEGQTVQGSGYTSDALLKNIASASTWSILGREYSKYHYAAVFSRFNYSFNDKYIFNVTARRDGSSRFGNEKRLANFGSLGAAWILSEEELIKENFAFVNFLKLRGSYGIIGNDQISDYGFLELWVSNGDVVSYQGVSTIAPSQLSNPNFAWEKNKKIETALEIGILKDKINFNVAYYKNSSSNQLISKQLPQSTGFNSIRDNLPAEINNTGWEFELNTNNYSRKDFNWTSAVNLTIPKNKLIAYPALETSADAVNYEIGSPLAILKVYNTYIDAKTGLFVREDYDKNGTIDDRDRYIIKNMGRQFYGGLQNMLSYKSFQLHFSFQFIKQTGRNGRSVANPGKFLINSPGSNQSTHMLDRWQKEGDIAYSQKYSTTSDASSSMLYAVNPGSQLSIDDSPSFIKLKNVSLSYDVTNQLQKMKLNSARIYLQGQNLVTFTKYKGLDPEIQSLGGVLPSLLVISAGLEIKF